MYWKPRRTAHDFCAPCPADQLSSCWHREQLVSSSEPSYLMSFFRQWWGINHNYRCEVTFRSWFDFRTTISFVVLVVKIPNALLVSWPPTQKRRKYILSPFLAAALRQGFFSRHRRTQKTYTVWNNKFVYPSCQGLIKAKNGRLVRAALDGLQSTVLSCKSRPVH